jgi:hypothetical protein
MRNRQRNPREGDEQKEALPGAHTEQGNRPQQRQRPPQHDPHAEGLERFHPQPRRHQRQHRQQQDKDQGTGPSKRCADDRMRA